MRILMLSWRGPGHPAAGGAEVMTHEVLRRWVTRGHDVTWFSAAVDGRPEAEEVDGIRIVRRGLQHTVHLHAWRWLRGRVDDYDRVIDQINTIPFFTHRYVPEARRRFWIFQLAREYWFRETRGVFRLGAPFGYLAEPRYLGTYRRTTGATISRSTSEDLVRCGIPPERITVVPMALDCPVADELAPKRGPLTLVSLGRLTPAKFVEEGLRAFAAVRRRVPDARMDVIGSGDPAYRARLEELVRALGVAGAVVFHGRVEARERQALLERAHVHVFASHREGWGLVVSEAAAVGTPSVGYDAPGVRDSIGEPTGLAPVGDVEALAARVLALVEDPDRYEAIRRAAWQRAREMDYDRTADALEAVLA